MTSTPTRPVDTVVIATKGLHDRSINIIAGTTVENKGKLILTISILSCSNEVFILFSFLFNFHLIFNFYFKV